MEQQLIPALYVVATPIGNLQDITLRAIQVLGHASVVFAEDTRVTRVLLDRHGISVPLQSYREAAPRPVVERTIQDVISRIQRGEVVAYVSDAGTPGVSDPGDYLVKKVREAGCAVVPIPGASALAAIVSVAGLGVQRPLFIGFLPRKKGKETMLKKLAEGLKADFYDGIVMYESPERVVSLLRSLGEWDLDLRICLGRELTKKFEQVISGNLQEVLLELEKNTVRGEVSLLIALDE
jgi:16S rRNA (cytidine1402-2'-O)-methyltransferase